MRRLRRTLVLFIAAAFLLVSVTGLYAQEAGKVNINKASAEEMTQLKRIGPSYAQRIVQYRTEHGPFTAPEDIMKVPGIGPRTYEDNKDRITIE